MTNNDILRRLRYTFEFNDDKMIAIFAAADKVVSRAEISNWLKKDDDPDYKSMHDIYFASFLNGLINTKRGRKDGEQPKPEKNLNNNIIFKKLKIALALRDEDILEILDLVNFRISKTELSAFFRNPDQNQYRPCKDQILRNFIHGLQIKYHPKEKE
ncbi:DUF1456 family protein [Pedobacter sp. SD-b]|uniref:DUF1456 family protein n=1 Tax=Pedobacter segetis TaxID=2793069 RepID=A0ABS1BFV5_9SPHI|nr:DUF1456 family protein [Pedobacter segetis]MBK0381700.1 DUF1456 family protein [Pedobacter segetis]